MGGLLSQLSAAGAFDDASVGDDCSAQGEPVYLWPESVEAWRHWQSLQTQWRTGMGGATGLDYAGVRAYLDEAGVEPGAERRELFECIQACEAACLDVWSRPRPGPGGGPPVNP